MSQKYCVFAFKTNYRSQQDKTVCGEINKIPVYHFPKNKDEREQWLKSVPNANLNVTILLFVNNIGLQILIP